MTTSAPDLAVHSQRLVAEVEPALRRYVASLVSDPHDVDDVVQEAMVRVLAAQGRLESAALTAYGITVGRNLVHDLHRREARHRGLIPRLVDGHEPDQPDDLVLGREERQALRVALEALPADQRDLMIAHDVHGAPLGDLQGDGSTGSVAARLSRARARTRVNYVLALRRLELPSERCRPVLNAVSAGDRRRQSVLRAGRHLVTCEVCADVAPVLLQRDRALAGFLPWGLLGAGASGLLAAARRSPFHAGTAVAATAAVVTVAVVSWPAAPTRVAPAPAPAAVHSAAPADLTVAGRALLPLRHRLDSVSGQVVQAWSVPVLAVPADEGFWVGHGSRMVWVQLTGPGESPVAVRIGDLVTFTGRLVSQGPDFASRVGVTEAEGADLLRREGHHVSVAGAAVKVVRR